MKKLHVIEIGDGAWLISSRSTGKEVEIGFAPLKNGKYKSGDELDDEDLNNVTIYNMELLISIKSMESALILKAAVDSAVEHFMRTGEK